MFRVDSSIYIHPVITGLVYLTAQNRLEDPGFLKMAIVIQNVMQIGKSLLKLFSTPTEYS